METWLFVYDGECSLCCGFAEYLAKFDNAMQVEPVALQRFIEQDQTFSKEELLEDVHLLGPSGEVMVGADALYKILLLAPVARPVRWMIESRAAKGASSVAYQAIRSFRRCSWCKRRRRT